jgi:hypothetical protein
MRTWRSEAMPGRFGGAMKRPGRFSHPAVSMAIFSRESMHCLAWSNESSLLERTP